MCSECKATELVGVQMTLQETLERVWALSEGEGLGVWVSDQLRAIVRDATKATEDREVPALIDAVFY
jgi:hypothetical protein